MKITLLGHSGFIVEGENTCLVFDYFTDGLELVDSLPFTAKKVVFFASHAHHDHYNKKILDYAKAGNVGYVFGTGIKAPSAVNAAVLDKGQAAEVLGVQVQAFGSTDSGVSFMTELEGRKIFHAGDLNDWYWEDESTSQELLHDEQWFFDEAAPLASTRPDVAFLPVDSRLKEHALRGPLHFVRTMEPGLVVPMHLCGGEGLPDELRRRLAQDGLRADVAQLVHPGDSITI